ncbi:hypothetical protein SEA_PUPPER_18 [Gordonia phage Pupper]|uniref:Uncharacterized protein n=1 Tax=Gordonia phage Pupper TaxID=2571249 RepID=A0A4Y6EKE0_9CAUD|nr:hypothetical protein KHQ83_gp018 [Gordonia phage Pupper]QDF18505.1 hypothetical protein SEA_PUPPER_18 [Gordonia phage Pupper]QDF18738.1 hypothetical protein SEA_SCENTAE_18 [Gordonia phage SCentae]
MIAIEFTEQARKPKDRRKVSIVLPQIEAIVRRPKSGKATIHLRSGAWFYLEESYEEVLDTINQMLADGDPVDQLAHYGRKPEGETP